ncbi:hypothetical protein [Anoxybacillus kestanbolensis]|uniref:hypothetical protein n=1 Tax=Anoxybacillus kestanbolensis TaxID=227476 RepID=UPI003D253C90
MNSLQKVAHRVVSSVANDLRDNTLTNLVSIPLGAAKGGQMAYKAATTGFTMLERKAGLKTTMGAVKGGAVGYIGGNVAAEVSNKIIGVEKWFDNNKIGKSIDKGITKAENWLHKAIGGGSY